MPDTELRQRKDLGTVTAGQDKFLEQYLDRIPFFAGGGCQLSKATPATVARQVAGCSTALRAGLACFAMGSSAHASAWSLGVTERSARVSDQESVLPEGPAAKDGGLEP